LSDFMEMVVGLLSSSSSLQDENNELRNVLDKTIGAYMDDQDNVFDQLFLSTATGSWLDCHGRDYGVTRKTDESDEDYRNRIIFEKLEYLTVGNLQSIYGLELFNYISSYSSSSNKLTSDNPYRTNKYMAFASDELKAILNNKFMLGGSITWL